MGSKESHFDSIRDDLEEKQQRLEAEIEGYSNRRKLYDAKEEDLEKEYENKRAELERTMQKKREALDTEYANFTKAKENFDTELKVFLLTNIFTDRSKAVLLLWIIYVVSVFFVMLSCTSVC